MKFGHTLKKAQDMSPPEWCDFWLNYKHLKKLIKNICRAKKDESAAADAPVSSGEERRSSSRQA